MDHSGAVDVAGVVVVAIEGHDARETPKLKCSGMCGIGMGSNAGGTGSVDDNTGVDDWTKKSGER